MSRTAHAGRKHVVERVAADLPVVVAMNQPMPDGSTQRLTGRLMAAVLCDGAVHHYRVSLGNGVMQMAPPGWIDPNSRETVLAAGLDGPQEWEATARAERLAFMRRVAAAWINAPDNAIPRIPTLAFLERTPAIAATVDGEPA